MLNRREALTRLAVLPVAALAGQIGQKPEPPTWMEYDDDGMPYRVAADMNSPFYDNYFVNNGVVYIDGKVPLDCEIADRREGWIQVLDPNDGLRTYKIRGDVRFAWDKDDPKAWDKPVSVIPR